MTGISFKKEFQRRIASAVKILLMLMVFGGTWSCTPKPKADLPQTIPVTGTVKSKGKRSFAGGMVSLQSTDPAGHTANGDISDDGSFSLRTIVGSDKLSGGVPGTYKVTLYPRMSEKQNETAVTLKNPVTIAADSKTLELVVD